MKKRLDEVIVDRELVESINVARGYIMRGLVFVDDNKIEKAGHLIEPNSKIRINIKDSKYVSRGGYKLEKALKFFSIDLNNKITMDIGSSTGGFTDCMLQNGAKKVYAVDVGYGQLDWKLRNDKRVIVMERTNIRNVGSEDLEDKLDFITVDVSFISLDLVLPIMDDLLNHEGEAIVLIKPQFEALREDVGEGGVIRDKNIHLKVLDSFKENLRDQNFIIEQLTYSPIKGATGNIEYLALLKKKNKDQLESVIDLEDIVEQSHINL